MKTSRTRTSLIALGLVIAASLSASVALAETKEGKPEGHKARGHHMFERMDENGDGKVTKAEAAKMSEERFKKFDTNADGSITEAEAQAAREKMHAARKKDGDKPERSHRKGHGPGHMFAKMDLNKDGKITRAEAKKVEDEKFAKLDTNKDGAITKQEAIDAHKARMQERREKRGDKGTNKSA